MGPYRRNDGVRTALGQIACGQGYLELVANRITGTLRSIQYLTEYLVLGPVREFPPVIRRGIVPVVKVGNSPERYRNGHSYCYILPGHDGSLLSMVVDMLLTG